MTVQHMSLIQTVLRHSEPITGWASVTILLSKTTLFLFHFKIKTRKTIRLIDSTDKKLINTELALLLNKTSKNENILPRYTDINFI